MASDLWLNIKKKLGLGTKEDEVRVADTNKDGVVDKDEFIAAISASMTDAKKNGYKLGSAEQSIVNALKKNDGTATIIEEFIKSYNEKGVIGGIAVGGYNLTKDDVAKIFTPYLPPKSDSSPGRQ